LATLESYSRDLVKDGKELYIISAVLAWEEREETGARLASMAKVLNSTSLSQRVLGR